MTGRLRIGLFVAALSLAGSFGACSLNPHPLPPLSAAGDGADASAGRGADASAFAGLDAESGDAAPPAVDGTAGDVDASDGGDGGDGAPLDGSTEAGDATTDAGSD